jgi:hypothetical protein
MVCKESASALGRKRRTYDSPLVARDDGTTNPLWRRLGLIHWNEARDLTDTETRKDTTGDKERDGGGSGLHGHTSRENDTAGYDSPPSAQNVGHGCSAKRTKERPQGEDGDDEGLVGSADHIFSLIVLISERLEPELDGNGQYCPTLSRNHLHPFP